MKLWIQIILIAILTTIIFIGGVRITEYAQSHSPDKLCNEMGYDVGEYENFKDGKLVWYAELICYNKVYSQDMENEK